jgi:hypothetical protein
MDLSKELIKDIKALEGFSTPLIEEDLINNLASKLDELTHESREERIRALHNMFALGQVFNSNQKGDE